MKPLFIKMVSWSFPVEVTPDKETVWLRVEEMAELFDRDRSVIQRHIKTYLIEQNSTCAKFT